jgi:MSHA biogenesis protein MshG
MPRYHYRARNASGQAVVGHLDAPSLTAAADQLLGSALIPVRIDIASAAIDWRQALPKGWSWQEKVKTEDLVLFCRQMHALTKAGVPILRALRGLRETTRNPSLSTALGDVIAGLESGRDLSHGLSRYPHVFPQLLCSMVEVGENTGSLADSFLQTAKYLEFEQATANQVKSALRYPTFVLVAISVAMALISLFVIPTFERVFRGFKAELPLPTKILMGISHFAVTFWPLVLLILVVGFFSLRHYLRTEAGLYQWGKLQLRLPVIGVIILQATMARFSRALAMSYSAGVQLVQALDLTARAVNNSYVGEKIDEMANGIQRGDTLSRTAANAKLFTPLVVQMLTVGEETGAVDIMLIDVAEYYEREVEYDMKNLTSAIEPILIIAIGGMVLVLALGVFLPMWNLAAVARGGG